jgi:hypothetical protein
LAKLSVYNARVCGDLAAIKASFAAELRRAANCGGEGINDSTHWGYKESK